MSCILALDYDHATSCTGAVGGIKRLGITKWANLSGTGSTFTAANGIVTAFTLATGTGFQKYNLKEEMGSFSDNGKRVETGAVLYEPVIEFSINGLDIALKVEFDSMARTPLCVIVQDENDTYWLVGKDRPMYLNTWTSETGAKHEDMNGHKCTLNGKSKMHVYKLTSTIGNTLLT